MLPTLRVVGGMNVSWMLCVNDQSVELVAVINYVLIMTHRFTLKVEGNFCLYSKVCVIL